MFNIVECSFSERRKVAKCKLKCDVLPKSAIQKPPNPV